MNNNAKTDRSSSDPVRKPFFNLSPYGNFRVASFLIALCVFLVVFLCAGIVILNGNIGAKIFWQFAKNASPETVAKIEIQRIEGPNKIIAQSVNIEDKNAISSFLSALSTVQEYQPDILVDEYPYRVFIHLKDIQTIEMDCYPLPGSNNIVIGSVFVRPFYTASSGVTAILPEPYFYDWLISVGVDIK